MNCPICGTLCHSTEGHHDEGSYSHECPNDCYWESRAFGNINVNIGIEDDDRLTLSWPIDTPEEEVKARRLLIAAFAEFFIYTTEALDARAAEAQPEEFPVFGGVSIVTDAHMPLTAAVAAATPGPITTFLNVADTRIRLHRTLTNAHEDRARPEHVDEEERRPPYPPVPAPGDEDIPF